MNRSGSDTGGRMPKPYLLLWRLLCLSIILLPMPVWAGPYSQSAHGDALAGVSRGIDDLASPGPYVTGNCAHCHEQHASMSGSEPQPSNSGPSPFALFSPGFVTSATLKPYQQADLFCFYCHTSTGSFQSGGLLLNFDYSNAFGGYANGPAGIFEAFNQPLAGVDASYHNLYDLWSYAQKFPGFNASSPPCDACHNAHRARRNKAYPHDPRFTAISRPTEHESLWGDADGEWMSSYGGGYQPPLYYGSRTTYEPAGTSIVDGSQTPDYNTFCLDCHWEKIRSTSLASLGGYVAAIDWKTSGGDQLGVGDKHGANPYTGSIMMKKPYDETIPSKDFLLSCLDCHEAHGSPNAFLVRRAVNGEALAGTFAQEKSTDSWGNLCGNCHQNDYSAGGGLSGGNRWRPVHHGTGASGGDVVADAAYLVAGGACDTCHDGSPGANPIGCGYCHFHGSYCDSTHPGTLPNGKTIPAPIGGFRRTF